MNFVPPKALRRNAQKTRRLWLHAGLHKTGTTSLQAFLARNREELARRGLLYVRAGTNPYLDGNHNIAWELTGDRRFELDTGTLEEAAQEIADFDGDSILSSEDFESLLHRPRGFDPLFRHPLLKHHQIRVVVYVRNQAEYLTSLWWENSRYHGIDWRIADYLEAILRDGRVTVREWTYQFDLPGWSRAWPHRGAKLILRNYHALAGGSSVMDFLSLLTPGLEPGETPRLNVSTQRVRLSDTDGARLMARFGPGNKRVCAAQGISDAGLTAVPVWAEGADVLV